MIRLFPLLIAFHLVGFLNAQIYISVAPWDNALSYHPSIVGLQSEESFQLNLYSQKSLPEDATRFIRSAIGNLVDLNTAGFKPTEVNHSYFLGYQKTFELKRQNSITGALQLQHFKEPNSVSENFTSAGFTINYHKPLAAQENRTRYVSFGYQANLVLNSPNKSLTSIEYSRLTAPSLSFDDFNAQFRNSGASQLLSLNYFYLHKKETSLLIGFTGAFNHTKRAFPDTSTQGGEVTVLGDGYFSGLLNIEFQKVLRKKIVVQVNLIEHFFKQLGVGVGFKLGRHSIFKFLVTQSGDLGYANLFSAPSSFTSMQFSLDMKRYKYIVTFGSTETKYLQFGVTYRLHERDTSTLLSISQ